MSRYSTSFDQYSPADPSQAEDFLLLNTTQAHQALNVSHEEVIELIESGELPALMIAGRLRIALSDLHAFKRSVKDYFQSE